MKTEEALYFVTTALEEKHLPRLKKLEKIIIRQVLQGKSYPEIAKDAHYQLQSIRNSSSVLWRKLSTAFDEPVNQDNLELVLKRFIGRRHHIHHNQIISINLEGANLTGASISAANLSEARRLGHFLNTYSKGDLYQNDLPDRNDEPEIELKKVDEKNDYIWNNVRFNTEVEVKIAEILDRMNIIFSPNTILRMIAAKGKVTKKVSFLIIVRGKCGILDIIPDEDNDLEDANHYILGQGIDLIRFYTENICQNNPELIIRDFLKGLRQETFNGSGE
jgi:hypothetical protein